MSNLPPCLQCGSVYTYRDGSQYLCPEYAYEWSVDATAAEDEDKPVHDANGNLLQDGDTVTVIDGDQDIDCSIDGIRDMQLKSKFVKRV